MTTHSVSSTPGTGANQQPHALAQMRIAIVSDAAPGRNGVGTFYVDLMEHLKPHVQAIELMCPTISENGKWNAGVVLPLPGDATQKLCMPNPFTLQRQLNNLRPHVIIVATPGVYGLFGAFLAGRMTIPAIAGFHTSFEELTRLYWSKSAAGKVVHGYFKVSNNYLFKKCKLVLANSEAMVEQAQRLNAPAVEIIDTIISPLFTQTPVREYHGECQRILFAGRLAPEKNIDLILAAARRLPHMQFSFAGDGPLRDRVEMAARKQSNITTLGWLNRQDLCRQIDDHHMLVLPSTFESFGTIALEAMARKRLVLVSPTCGIADWPEYANGLYVMDHQNLTRCIHNVLAQTPEQRIEKADTAMAITRNLNRDSLQHWSDMLLRMVRLFAR